MKKLAGGKSYFRVRVGSYRLGFAAKGDTVTLIRFLHRKEVYRYFP
jgi:mRNA interferase RelE/StbE